jgi:hypothetical protein
MVDAPAAEEDQVAEQAMEEDEEVERRVNIVGPAFSLIDISHTHRT